MVGDDMVGPLDPVMQVADTVDFVTDGKPEPNQSLLYFVSVGAGTSANAQVDRPDPGSAVTILNDD